MKRSIQSYLSLALCALLIAGSILSCGDSGKKDPALTTASVVDQQTNAGEEETTQLKPDLPEQDFGGYSFRVLTKGAFNTHWTSRDIYAAEATGDPINDAVYERNMRVSEKYNFTVVEDASQSDPGGAAKKVILAGEDAYDMLAMGISSNTSLFTEGMLIDFKDLTFVDLDRPWYDHNCRDSLSIAKKVFIMTGDLVIMDKDATWSIMFNKNFATTLSLPDLYAQVNEGKWTMDLMYSCMVNASTDINGDGTHDYDDSWGLAGEAWNNGALIAGAGVRVFSKDDDDIPYISMNTERYYQAFEIASKINGDKDKSLLSNNVKGFADVWEDCFHKAFKEDRLLFYFTGLNRCTLLRSMETDFGILPVPKYDEAQTNYYNLISLWSGNGFSVPKTVTDLERTSIIIEALSAESMYTLTPAYYEITLKTKLSRDEESSAMLDIIFSSRIYELGIMFGWGGLFDLPASLVGKDSTAIASSVEKRIASTEKAIQKDLDKILAF